MPASERNAVQPSNHGGSFTTTNWTVVLSAGQVGSLDSETALSALYQTYWYPLYVFARRCGQNAEDARDLVQGFFAKLLEKNYLKVADPEKGKFRSFLLNAFKRFMANEWDRARCKKRGGQHIVVSLSEPETETRYRAEPAHEMTPEKAFERRWAITLLDQVLSRLEAEFIASGKGQMFTELKIFLTGEKSDLPAADIGRRIGLSDGALRAAVHRLRKRYRELLRLEIGRTVDRPEAVDEEIRELFVTVS
jgi:RNA polymerase sigma-70 factor (ECF subfamily)